jgi:prepilin-type N-terminal cleavage/methylation domain-containing protein
MKIKVPALPARPSPSRKSGGFTLVEILVVLVLLSLIVFALMAVFGATQRALRSSLTYTDTLESGRAVMDEVTSDLQSMTPSDANSNLFFLNYSNPPVNFYAGVKFFSALPSPPSPLFQPLLASSTGAQRTNIIEDIFILSRGNINGVPSWIGTGYSVTTNLPDGTLYPLYRFYMTTNLASGPLGQASLFGWFSQFQYTNSALWSHLMDGVVHLTAQVYDTNGYWMTNGVNLNVLPNYKVPRFVNFAAAGQGILESDVAFYSNAVPASVQIELGTIEDTTLSHAEGLVGLNQSNYLANSANTVHVFRQRVWIRNLDPTAYQ